MTKNKSKQYTYFIILTFFLLFLVIPVSAADGSNNSSFFPGLTTDSGIQTYIQAIYMYAIGVVGIIATIVIMIGGLIWISSMGNAARVTTAKDWIGAAISGLALAMFSYTILYIINPDLTKFEPLNPKPIGAMADKGEIENVKTGCCFKQNGKGKPVTCTDNTTEKSCVASGGTLNPKSCTVINACRSNIAQETGSKFDAATNCPPNLYPDYCKDCINCAIVDGVQANDGNKLEANLATGIHNVCAPTRDCKLNEGWPPAENSHHVSLCHKNGSCADIGLTSKSTDPKDVLDLYTRLKDQGLNPTWEPAGGGSCGPYTGVGIKCNPNSNSTGAHFHVTK